MASAIAAKSAGSGKGKSDPGGGPGVSTSGQVKSTMTNPFGKRNTKRSTGKRAGSRR